MSKKDFFGILDKNGIKLNQMSITRVNHDHERHGMIRYLEALKCIHINDAAGSWEVVT